MQEKSGDISGDISDISGVHSQLNDDYSIDRNALYARSTQVKAVCLSVCLSQVRVVQRWLNLGSH